MNLNQNLFKSTFNTKFNEEHGNTAGSKWFSRNYKLDLNSMLHSWWDKSLEYWSAYASHKTRASPHFYGKVVKTFCPYYPTYFHFNKRKFFFHHHQTRFKSFPWSSSISNKQLSFRYETLLLFFFILMLNPSERKTLRRKLRCNAEELFLKIRHSFKILSTKLFASKSCWNFFNGIVWNV